MANQGPPLKCVKRNDCLLRIGASRIGGVGGRSAQATNDTAMAGREGRGERGKRKTQPPKYGSHNELAALHLSQSQTLAAS
jgi:hypothetical protein